MKLRIPLLAIAALLLQSPAIAAGSFNSNHPEEAYPDNLPAMTSPGPYSGFIKNVQQQLHEQGFDAGPVNGDFGTKTQAALAQFQLSRALPASGMLDDQTLQQLGVQRDTQASAGDLRAAQGGTVEVDMKREGGPSSAASGK